MERLLSPRKLIRYFQTAIYILIFSLFFSCQKFDYTDESINRFKYYNGLLINELNNRNQLIQISYDTSICSIVFEDRMSIRFSSEIYPILIASRTNCWSISGNETDIHIKHNRDGSLIIPDLTIGESNDWVIDGVSSNISAEKYINCTANRELNGELLLQGLVLSDNVISFIFSDKTSYSLSAIKDDLYLVPSYYKMHLIEKEILAEKAISESNNNCAAFVFFSDSHWNNNYKHSPALIRHITEYSGINKVFFGGDVIYKRESDPLNALHEGLDFQKAFTFLGPHFYCLFGNHDDNSDGQPNNASLHLTNEQVISYLQSQMTVLDRKEGYNFYFDDNDSRTRFIGLDTGRYRYAQFRSTTINTARFLIESLQDVPDDWHVIILSHIIIGAVIKDGVYECCLASLNNYIYNIMDSYNQRQTGQFTYNKETIFYDFSSCSGHIELGLSGHVHKEGLLYTEGGIPLIAVTTDSRETIDNEVAKKGSISEQSVSIIVLDYTSQKIHLYVVGRGEDLVI